MKVWINNGDGLGFVDYTRYVVGESIQIQDSINVPTLCTLNLKNYGPFKVPVRSAYMKIVSEINLGSPSLSGVAPSGALILFSGYITNEPVRVFQGVGSSYPQQSFQSYQYQISATSDEWLLNVKSVPYIPAFVNTSQGKILKNIANALCPGIFDFTGVQDGDVVPYFQYSSDKTWADIAKQFGDASRYHYYCKGHKIYYVPFGDFPLGISYDDSPGVGSRTFDPMGLQSGVLTVPIVNDAIVLGDIEPQNIREDNFVGTGFDTNFQLAHEMFEGTTSILLQQDWTSQDYGTDVWTLNDPQGNFDFSAGAMNITGGPRFFDGVSGSNLIGNNVMQLGGALHLQHGEFLFTNTACSGIVGGVYPDVNHFQLTDCIAGFAILAASGSSGGGGGGGQSIVSSNHIPMPGAVTGAGANGGGTIGFALDPTRAYVFAASMYTAGGVNYSVLSRINTSTNTRELDVLWPNAHDGSYIQSLVVDTDGNLYVLNNPSGGTGSTVNPKVWKLDLNFNILASTTVALVTGATIGNRSGQLILVTNGGTKYLAVVGEEITNTAAGGVVILKRSDLSQVGATYIGGLYTFAGGSYTTTFQGVADNNGNIWVSAQIDATSLVKIVFNSGGIVSATKFTGVTSDTGHVFDFRYDTVDNAIITANNTPGGNNLQWRKISVAGTPTVVASLMGSYWSPAWGNTEIGDFMYYANEVSSKTQWAAGDLLPIYGYDPGTGKVAHVYLMDHTFVLNDITSAGFTPQATNGPNGLWQLKENIDAASLNGPMYYDQNNSCLWANETGNSGDQYWERFNLGSTGSSGGSGSISAVGVSGVGIQPIFNGVEQGPIVLSKVNHKYYLQTIFNANYWARYNQAYRTLGNTQFGGTNIQANAVVTFIISDFDFSPPADWQPNYPYKPGDLIQPLLNNPGAFTFVAVSATGNSGAVEPSSWIQFPGDTVQDGGIVWANNSDNVIITERVPTLTQYSVTGSIPSFALYGLINNSNLWCAVNNTIAYLPPQGTLSVKSLYGPSGAQLPLTPTQIGPETQYLLGFGGINEVATIGQTSNSQTNDLQFYSDTIPSVGSRIRLRSWEAGVAVGRVQDPASIAREAAVVGDDGERLAMLSDLQPLPATSAECELAAAAAISDREMVQFQGAYTVMDDFWDKTKDYPKTGRYFYAKSLQRNMFTTVGAISFSGTGAINFGQPLSLFIEDDWSFGTWIYCPPNAHGTIVGFGDGGAGNPKGQFPYTVAIAGGPTTFDIVYGQDVGNDSTVINGPYDTIALGLPVNTWIYLGLSRQSGVGVTVYWAVDGGIMTPGTFQSYTGVLTVTSPTGDANSNFQLGTMSHTSSPPSPTTWLPTYCIMQAAYMWHKNLSRADHINAMNGVIPSTGLVLLANDLVTSSVDGGFGLLGHPIGAYTYVSGRTGTLPVTLATISITTTVVELRSEKLNFSVNFGPDQYLERLLPKFLAKSESVLAPKPATIRPNPIALANLGTTYIPDLVSATVSGYDSSSVIIDLGSVPATGVEIRRSDLGWGKGNLTKNLIGVFTTRFVNLPRTAYKQVWYMRQVNGSQTSRNTTALRVVAPIYPIAPLGILNLSSPSVPQIQLGFDQNTDIRNICGIEIRGADNTTVLFQRRYGAPSDLNFIIDNSVNKFTEFKFYCYFFNLLWGYSAPLVLDGTVLGPIIGNLRVDDSQQLLEWDILQDTPTEYFIVITGGTPGASGNTGAINIPLPTDASYSSSDWFFQASEMKTTGTPFRQLGYLTALAGLVLGGALPAGAKILGISFTTNVYQQNPSPATLQNVALFYKGKTYGQVKNVNIVLPSANGAGGFSSPTTVGSSTDLWGTDTLGLPLTTAIVTDPTFGIGIQVNQQGTNCFDNTSNITVWYQASGGAVSESITISGTNLIQYALSDADFYNTRTIAVTPFNGILYGPTVTITHTYVPGSTGGSGSAGQVVQLQSTSRYFQLSSFTTIIPDDGYLHARMYGAKGDGVTDDTTALQSAINAAWLGSPSASGRKIVFVPSDMNCKLSAFTASGGNYVALQIPAGVGFIQDGTLTVGAASGSPSFAAVREGVLFTNTPGWPYRHRGKYSINSSQSIVPLAVHTTVELTASGITLTLPPAAGCSGAFLWVKNLASGANTLAGATTGDKIDGLTTQTLSYFNNWLGLYSNGSGWDIVSNSTASGLLGGNSQIAFLVSNSTTGNNVGPELTYLRTGQLNRCVVTVKTSDGSVPFQFRIKRNGTDIFSSDPTIAAGTASGSQLTFTTLTSLPLNIANGDLFTLDILQGSTTWNVTIQVSS